MRVFLECFDLDLMLEFYIKKINGGPVSRRGAHGMETSAYFNDPE